MPLLRQQSTIFSISLEVNSDRFLCRYLWPGGSSWSFYA